MRLLYDWFMVILFAALFIVPIVMDRFTPYARECRAHGGVPAISNRVCYVETTKTIMRR